MPNMVNRVQLTMDGHRAYLDAVEGALGADADCVMPVKHQSGPTGPRGR